MSHPLILPNLAILERVKFIDYFFSFGIMEYRAHVLFFLMKSFKFEVWDFKKKLFKDKLLNLSNRRVQINMWSSLFSFFNLFTILPLKTFSLS